MGPLGGLGVVGVDVEVGCFTSPGPAKYALVVDPIIDKYGMSKVLMDGGNSINILYLEKLHHMKQSEA
jgi:hypothetical protein